MKFSRLLLLSLFAFLGGCSHFTSSYFVNSHDKTYLQARSIPPIRVPPGMSSSAFNTTYPIPDRNYPPSTRYVSLVPPGLTN